MIFYFSGTGNSRLAAEKIAEKTGNELINITDAVKTKKFSYRIGTNEKLGFVFPVYYSGVPRIVAEFIEEANFIAEDDCCIFAVLTCGGSAVGADAQLKKLFKEKALEVSYIAEIKMPDNYVMIYNPADKDKAEAVTKNAMNELSAVADAINGGKKGGFNSGAVGKIANSVMQTAFNIMRTTKKFYADESCISCGKCESLCPVGAIKITDGKPKWIKSKCEHCTACINRCPQKAIQYGTKTKNRGRYSIDEIFD